VCALHWRRDPGPAERAQAARGRGWLRERVCEDNKVGRAFDQRRTACIIRVSFTQIVTCAGPLTTSAEAMHLCGRIYSQWAPVDEFVCLAVSVYIPFQNFRVVSPTISVETYVEDPDKVTLIQHDGALMIFVTHAPDPVLRVVVAGQLSLSPERRPQLVRSPAAAPISLNGEILLRRYPRRNGTRSLAHDVV
jgi:hypothetical protein